MSDEPAIEIEDGEVVGGTQASEEAQQRESSGRSREREERTSDDFDPDDYPEARTVSELGEIRREEYGLTDQEQRRVERGEDPVPDGGTGFVQFDRDEGEVLSRGDTREEAAADRLQSEIREAERRGRELDTSNIRSENLPFDQQLSDTSDFQARQAREVSEQLMEQAENLPDTERLQLEGELREELGPRANPEQVQNLLQQEARNFETEARNLETQTRQLQQLEQTTTPTPSPTPQTNNFENFQPFDPLEQVPVDPDQTIDPTETALIGPNEENQEDFMTVGTELPSGTQIQGTNFMQQQDQLALQQMEGGILPDPGQAGAEAGRTARELGQTTLGEAVLDEEQQENATGILQDVRPLGFLEDVDEQIETGTALGVQTLGTPAAIGEFGSDFRDRGFEAVDEAIDNLDQLIVGSPELDLTDEQVSPGQIRAATPSEDGTRSPSEISREAGELGVLATAVSAPALTGTPVLGAGAIPSRTGTASTGSRSTPVRTRSELDPEDIPTLDQLPEGFTARTDEPITGLSDPILGETTSIPGTTVRRRLPDEDFRAQTRQGTDRLQVEDGLTPTEREVLGQRIERQTGQTERTTIETILDDIEDIINDPKGQARLIPQTRQRDIQEPNIIGMERRTIEEDLADVGRIDQTQRPLDRPTSQIETAPDRAGLGIIPETTDIQEIDSLEETILESDIQQDIATLQEDITTPITEPVQESLTDTVQTSTTRTAAGSTVPAQTQTDLPTRTLPQTTRRTPQTTGRPFRPFGFPIPLPSLDEEDETIEEELQIIEQEPQAFPDIFSVIEGETEARDQDIFTGFEDRVNRELDQL